MSVTSSSGWVTGCVEGVMLDVTGVLYNSGVGDGKVIEGSVQALQRLQSSGLPFRLVSNESTKTRSQLVAKLHRLGYTALDEKMVFTPAPACRQFCLQNDLRPHLLTTQAVKAEFSDVPQTDPNCVVMGDAQEEFTYTNMNVAFNLLLAMHTPRLITMGMGRYYMETNGLKLDVGAYSKALEFACDVKAEVIGKPNQLFFDTAINDMQLQKSEVLMIGDDIVSDVGGAQACGIRAVQVRTGKWRSEWENHVSVRPDAVVDNLAQAVDWLLK